MCDIIIEVTTKILVHVSPMREWCMAQTSTMAQISTMVQSAGTLFSRLPGGLNTSVVNTTSTTPTFTPNSSSMNAQDNPYFFYTNSVSSNSTLSVYNNNVINTHFHSPLLNMLSLSHTQMHEVWTFKAISQYLCMNSFSFNCPSAGVMIV